MNDIDMIFLYQQYLEEIDLSFLEGIDKRKRELEENNNKGDDQNE